MENKGKIAVRRYCEKCDERVVKDGTHPNGKQRWYCKACNSSLIHSNDYKEKLSSLKLFYKWITNQAIQTMLYAKSRWTFQRRTAWCWNITPIPKVPKSINVLVVDGTYIKKGPCCIIAKADGYIVGYVWCKHECIEAYVELFSKLPRPTALVTDGFIGCVTAAEIVYGEGINIQRCVFHVKKFAIPLLRACTSHKAGKELLDIVHDITKVTTPNDFLIWMGNFNIWRDKWDDILSKPVKMRDYTTGREYISQKNLLEKIRKARRHILNALENMNMFSYVFYEGVPNTSNHVEGGTNSRLKTLIRCHPGLSLEKRKRVFEWRLWQKSIDPNLKDFL